MDDRRYRVRGAVECVPARRLDSAPARAPRGRYRLRVGGTARSVDADPTRSLLPTSSSLAWPASQPLLIQNFATPASPRSVTFISLYAEHVPTEFEDTTHYLRGIDGTDIEPLHEMPEVPEPEKVGPSTVNTNCEIFSIQYSVYDLWTRLGRPSALRPRPRWHAAAAQADSPLVVPRAHTYHARQVLATARRLTDRHDPDLDPDPQPWALVILSCALVNLMTFCGVALTGSDKRCLLHVESLH